MKQPTKHVLDPEIANLVTELNTRGYETISSCAGHPRHKYYHKGWIYFARTLLPDELQEVKQLAREYGLANLKVENPRPDFDYTAIYFSAIGGSR